MISKRKSPGIFIPTNIKPRPDDVEISAAVILARHFQKDVRFIQRTTSKTADIMIGNIAWEIKSPTGKGKRNIQHQFSRALKQSCNFVFDARHSKIPESKIKKELEKQKKLTKRLKKLVLITKDEEVLEF